MISRSIRISPEIFIKITLLYVLEIITSITSKREICTSIKISSKFRRNINCTLCITNIEIHVYRIILELMPLFQDKRSNPVNIS